MKTHLLFLLSAAFLSVSHASELPGYDFHYSAVGDGAIRPVQIFDDGTHLYLQFRSPDMIPAVFVNTENGVTRLPVHQDFPYIVVDRLGPEILVKVGDQQAIIRYDGGRTLTDNGSMTGSSEPLSLTSAASIPAESDPGAATPFSNSESPESFSGELIFNQTPTVIKTETHAAATGTYMSANSAVPVSVPVALTKSNVHIVSEGESLSLIAQKYHVSVHQIIILNNLHHVNLIYAGQKLLLPADIRGASKLIETAASPGRKQNTGYKKITARSGQTVTENDLHDHRIHRRAQFRLYEKTASGDVDIKEISSLAEIGTMANLSHAIYLRGTEADIDLRRAALTKYGINPAKIHVIKRLRDAGPDDGIVDIVFSNKDQE